MYLLHPCATSAFIAAVQPPAPHTLANRERNVTETQLICHPVPAANEMKDLAAFVTWFSVYSAAVSFPASAAQLLAGAFADDA
jgi:hypothetical protein